MREQEGSYRSGRVYQFLARLFQGLLDALLAVFLKVRAGSGWSGKRTSVRHWIAKRKMYARSGRSVTSFFNRSG